MNNCDPNATFVKFADDTTILVSGKTEEEASLKMNNTLIKVERWFTQNKLNLNPAKTRYMIFNKSTDIDNHLSINGINITRVWQKGQEKSFKLVGINIDEKLNWNEHIIAVGKKIASAAYGLHKTRNDLTSKNKTLIYSGLIHSHLTYGLSIWGHAKMSRLNQLLVKQKKAIRLIHNLKYRTHTLPYFVKSKILQLPELIDHTTLCYIQSGLHKDSPLHIQDLWSKRTTQRTDLRSQGITLHIPVSHSRLVNESPSSNHSRVWNNQPHNKATKEGSPGAFKHANKFDLLSEYLDDMTPEERDIALELE